MAAVNPIENTQLCKHFSALTSKQATNLCFYSTGASYQDISSLLETSPGTIKKSLESVQKHFNSGSLPELKTVFWACITFQLICSKYGIDGQKISNALNLDKICALAPVFPELNKCQMAGAVLYSIGYSVADIALKSSYTCAQIEQYILEAMSELGAASKQLLRILITSRFIVDLC